MRRGTQLPECLQDYLQNYCDTRQLGGVDQTEYGKKVKNQIGRKTDIKMYCWGAIQRDNGKIILQPLDKPGKQPDPRCFGPAGQGEVLPPFCFDLLQELLMDPPRRPGAVRGTVKPWPGGSRGLLGPRPPRHLERPAAAAAPARAVAAAGSRSVILLWQHVQSGAQSTTGGRGAGSQDCRIL